MENKWVDSILHEEELSTLNSQKWNGYFSIFRRIQRLIIGLSIGVYLGLTCQFHELIAFLFIGVLQIFAIAKIRMMLKPGEADLLTIVRQRYLPVILLTIFATLITSLGESVFNVYD